MAHGPTARGKTTLADEEAGNELKLGEFQNVPTLSLSAAKVLIDTVLDHRADQQRREIPQTPSVHPRQPLSYTTRAHKALWRIRC